ncbi:MAG: hotdog fold thioesterase [Succinivibrionaceae bacterium]
MIWKKDITLDKLNSLSSGNMLEFLDIKFTEIGDDYIIATMPVCSKTHQPFGLLHGGASVVLAETVGSIAGNYACGYDYSCLGLDINANHLRAVKLGLLYAKATPIHLGSTTQVWNIVIEDDKQHKVCISRLTLAVRKHMTLTSK